MFNYNDYKYILKRVIIYFLIAFAMFIISTFKVHALTTNVTDDIDNIKINNSYLKTNNKVYNAGNQNTTLELLTQGESYSQQWKYAYVSYCSAFGNMPERYVNSYIVNSSDYISDITIYNTSQTCTIYGTNAYNATGRAVYYVLNLRDAWWNYENGKANGNLKFTFWQSGSTEYTLISYGFNLEGYDFSNLNNNAISVEINNQTTAINNQTTEIQNINDSINDSSVDTNQAQSAFGDLDNNLPSNGTISSLITMPITIINQIISAFGGSCSSYNIGQLWEYDFVLPCINPVDYVGATLWGILDTICSGFIAFVIGKRFVVIFNELTNLKDGGLKSAYD